jgi:hypothetical protein
MQNFQAVVEQRGHHAAQNPDADEDADNGQNHDGLKRIGDAVEHAGFDLFPTEPGPQTDHGGHENAEQNGNMGIGFIAQDRQADKDDQSRIDSNASHRYGSRFSRLVSMIFLPLIFRVR